MDSTVSLPSHSGSPGLHHPAGLGHPRWLAISSTVLCVLALGLAALLRSPSGTAPTAPRSLTVMVGHGPIALALDERGGHLFVANYDDATLSLLDAHTGALLRTIALGQQPLDIAVDGATGRVFILNAGGPATPLTSPPAGVASVSVLDARTGTLLRTLLPGPQPSALAVDERHDRVFVLNSGDDTLSLLDARSGGVLATVPLDGLPQALAVDEVIGRVYVGTNGRHGQLLVLDSRTGRRLRSLTLGQSVGAVLAVPAAHRVLVAGDGVLRLLAARNGVLQGTLRAAVVPLLAVAGSTRVLVTGAAGLRLLDARTERWCGPWALSDMALPPLWSEDAASDPATGDLLVAMQPAGTMGRLAVLDGRGGRVLRLLPAGANPVALAFDAPTRQAMVLLPAKDAPAQGTGPLAALRGWSQRWLPWLPLPRPAAVRPDGSVRLISLR